MEIVGVEGENPGGEPEAGASRQISKIIFPEARRGGKSQGRFC
jgi:hypothetical protein